MRLLLFLQIALAVLAAVTILAADRLGQPQLIYVGALCLGGLMALAGVDSIITRHVRFFDVRVGGSTYQGFAAQLWGLTFVVMGLAIAAFGVSGFTNPDDRSLTELLLEQPGIPLLAMGTFLLGAGGATLIGPSYSRRRGQSLLLDLPYRLAGVIGIVLGATTLALGVVAIMSPDQLEDAVNLILDTLFRLLG